ncbi:MAG: radical SAM protein [Myxococcota bacterium]
MRRAADRLLEGEDIAQTVAGWAAGESRWLASAKIKLVDGCNLRCFMCSYWKRRRDNELTTVEVEGILDDLQGLGCRKLHLTGGELYLRRDTNHLIRYATARGMRVNLTTNGTLLDKPRLKELLRIPARSVTVSLDAPEPRAHDALRGRPGAWKKSTKTLDRLLDKRGSKTKIRLNTVVSRRNLHLLAGWPDFLRQRLVDGWLLIPLDAQDGSADHLTAADIAHYNARIAPLLAERVQIAGFDPWIYGQGPDQTALSANNRFARGYYQRRRCYAPWAHTLVGPTGDVYLCCNTHRRIDPLGSVRDKPLREIFNDAPYRALRQAMWTQRIGWCHRCADFLEENQAIEEVVCGAS